MQKYLEKLDKEVEKWIKSGKNLRYIALIGVVLVVIITLKITNAIFGQTYGYATIYGKTYKTVIIGNKTWMAENLNYETRWSKCYDNIFQNCYKYGRLYNWYTAKKICPEGWHLPANNEWEDLIDKKSAQKFGFAALLSGVGIPTAGSDSNTINVKYFNIDHSGFWWTSTDFNTDAAIARELFDNEERFGWRNYDKFGMFSVRCIKN